MALEASCKGRADSVQVVMDLGEFLNYVTRLYGLHRMDGVEIIKIIQGQTYSANLDKVVADYLENRGTTRPGKAVPAGNGGGA